MLPPACRGPQVAVEALGSQEGELDFGRLEASGWGAGLGGCAVWVWTGYKWLLVERPKRADLSQSID